MLKQICTSKPQSLLIGCPTKHLNCTFSIKLSSNMNPILKPRNSLIGSYPKTPRNELNVGVFRKFSSGFYSKNGFTDYQLIIARGLSSYSSQKFGENKKTLPWIAKAKAREVKRSQNAVTEKTRSPWEVSAEKLVQEKVSVTETRDSYRSKDKEKFYRDESNRVEEEEEEEEREEFKEPRWDKIKPKFNRFDEMKRGSNRPEFRKWNKEENWGKNTWKEATESSLPKIIGEVIYGVGPILAALLAERREFYALYVQEGLDLSGNNRKKKDKKGFEKILKMAEKIGLSKKEVSKHDLNMIVDNRPHQGLVLDASPLEMVSVKELESVSLDQDQEKGIVWVALDEVTDPQNLGAIIRSSYFFGASGVILCAKNSAPLSGVVSKASAGSLELMELRSCKNMMQFLTLSSENGWRVLGGSISSKAVPLNKIASGGPTILVLGSEGMGLRPLVERSCTELVRIEGNIPVNLTNVVDDEDGAQEFSSFMAVESLNVSVAAGVLLHHLIGFEERK